MITFLILVVSLFIMVRVLRRMFPPIVVELPPPTMAIYTPSITIHVHLEHPERTS
jgi:hypothetical protein